MEFYVEPEIKKLIDDPDSIPITEDRFFILTKEQLKKLEELVIRIEDISTKQVNSMSDKEKLELSTYINIADRLIKHSVIE